MSDQTKCPECGKEIPKLSRDVCGTCGYPPASSDKEESWAEKCVRHGEPVIDKTLRECEAELAHCRSLATASSDSVTDWKPVPDPSSSSDSVKAGEREPNFVGQILSTFHGPHIYHFQVKMIGSDGRPTQMESVSVIEDKRSVSDKLPTRQNALTEKTVTEPGWYWFKPQNELICPKMVHVSICHERPWIDSCGQPWRYPGTYYGPIDTAAIESNSVHSGGNQGSDT